MEEKRTRGIPAGPTCYYPGGAGICVHAVRPPGLRVPVCGKHGGLQLHDVYKLYACREAAGQSEGDGDALQRGGKEKNT